MNFDVSTRRNGGSHRQLTSGCKLLIAIALLSFSSSHSQAKQLLTPPSGPISVEDSKPIRQLLSDQWERGPINESQSKQTYANTPRSTPNLMIAYALNRMQHNRVKEASKVLEQLTQSNPKHLDGWMFQVWIDALSDRYDAALIKARTLKKHAAQANLDARRKRALFKRLGRLIGYMQGPVADRVNDDILDDTMNSITAGLKPDVLQAFTESRIQILKQFEDLRKVQGQRTQTELAKEKVKNDNELVALERQIDMFDKTESQLIPEKQQLKQDADTQLSKLEQQESSLEQQLSIISSDIWDTEQDLSYLTTELFNAQQLPPRLRPSLFYLTNQIRNARVTLSALRSNGNQISNQLRLVRAQVIQTRGAYDQRIAEINREIKRVNGAKRRSLARVARLAEGPKVAQGKKDSMKNKITALRTYDELPRLLYRQELLDQLTDQ